MLEQILKSIPQRKLQYYHVYFDNLFCCPDLLVHLRNAGLKATGTVRDNRVPVKNVLAKKAPRGTHVVQHEVKSGMNFITVQDSKPVSILSTAAGVTPLTNVKRYNKNTKEKAELPFPNAFTVYNKFMGEVDVHDQYCNRVLPIIRSKKWTWVIFVRIIQASITNATVTWNTAAECEKKKGIKEFALEISKYYLNQNLLKKHQFEKGQKQTYCSRKQCEVSTRKYCTGCDNAYFCDKCFKIFH